MCIPSAVSLNIVQHMLQGTGPYPVFAATVVKCSQMSMLHCGFGARTPLTCIQFMHQTWDCPSTDKMTVKAVWSGGNRFEARADDCEPVSMEWGGERKNASPMELLLMALAGCTGIDVVDILKKMREAVTRVEVSVSAERREEYPKIWKNIDVRYDIYGRGLSNEKSEKAVKLSVEKYCSVSAMFRDDVSLKHCFVLHEIEN